MEQDAWAPCLIARKNAFETRGTPGVRRRGRITTIYNIDLCPARSLFQWAL